MDYRRVAGLGLDADKQHMESKMDEHKLKCALIH